MKFKQNKAVYGTVITLVILAAGSLALNNLGCRPLGYHPTVHSAVEAIGSLVALLTWFFLYRSANPDDKVLQWLAQGFLAMGILDGFHALLVPGNHFVLIHCLSDLFGGTLFAMSWSTLFWTSFRTRLAAFLTACTALLVGLTSIFWPHGMPVFWSNGHYTSLAVAMNRLAAILFFLAGLYFVRLLLSGKRNPGVLLSVVLAVLLGVSSILLEFSNLWNSFWWTLHAVRLSAYIFTLWYLLRGVGQMQTELSKSNQMLARQQAEIEQVNAELRRQTDSLKQSEEKLIAQQQKMVTFNTELEEKTLFLEEQKQEILEKNRESELNNWLKTGQTELEKHMRGNKQPEVLCRNILTFVCNYLQAEVGTMYLLSSPDTLQFTAGYAFDSNRPHFSEFKIGEGFPGQVAQDGRRMLLKTFPNNYMQMKSSLGTKNPELIVISPLIFEGQTLGVYELGCSHDLENIHYDFLDSIHDSVAISIQSLLSRIRLDEALSRAQLQAEELQVQQEELEKANEELRQQTDILIQSERKLMIQQEELQASNEELAQKTLYLEEQKKEIDRKNHTLEEARNTLSVKARELEVTSQYKSDFLANMSHELRTPLNSLLILAQQLHRNKEQNLMPDQVKAAEVIYSSGSDLLHLINDILDLSKIESGKMILQWEDVSLSQLVESLQNRCLPLIQEKGLEFTLKIDTTLPHTIRTDRTRTEQVLMNLLSNAMKFTETGTVGLHFYPAEPDRNQNQQDNHPGMLAMEISDTGMGIPEDKQQIIFEAFQQVDSSISRKFGGTGLGLSISRELANLLGGKLQLRSTLGKGSVFTLLVPMIPNPSRNESQIESGEGRRKPDLSSLLSDGMQPAPAVSDDRLSLHNGDCIVMVIDHDSHSTAYIHDQCRKNELKFLHALNGNEGIELVYKYPVEAILLALDLQDMPGEEVLLALKSESCTRHIPVVTLLGANCSIPALCKGALAIVQKPLNPKRFDTVFNTLLGFIAKKTKSLLIVEDNQLIREKLTELLAADDLTITLLDTGMQAVKAIQDTSYDCMILDLMLPDISGIELLQKLQADAAKPLPPIIVYTAKDLTRQEAEQLQKYARSIIIKGPNSNERIFEETSLFLHRPSTSLTPKGQQMLQKIYDHETIFKGKSVLLVDDDMRNVFAISQVLEEKGMDIHIASNGKLALEKLQSGKAIDMVLMDIMMPVMDGYEAIRRIRSQECFWKLPIVALTAKAMKDDREKCMAAGANDYLSKPIHIERLLALMRIWFFN